MPIFIWNFSTLTTTGYEPDVDTVGGISIQSMGDGPPVTPNAVTCPSVPGETGNGRLLASFGHFNGFSTDRDLALAYTAGNLIALTFKWRPLVEFVSGSNSMFGFSLYGFNSSGMSGLYTLDVSLDNTATPGQYDFVVRIPTSTTLSATLSLRDWHEISMVYDGAGTLNFAVDAVSIGSVAMSIPTSPRGLLAFRPNFGQPLAVIGVLDEVILNIDF